MTALTTENSATAEEGHHFLRSRCSIRWYRPEAISADVLDRILVSAATAPSAHNRQPWRYFVLGDDASKGAVARTMGSRLMEDRRRDGDADAVINEDVERSYRRIVGAPIVVLVALSLKPMDRYADAARNNAEYIMAVQSTAMATQNLLLAAHAEGLGACWMCAPLFCPREVHSILGMPDDWQPQGLITLGHPAGPPRPAKPRSAVCDFVRFHVPV
jgi:F420 biosynthesis protein FbiB-like protein